MGSQHLIGLFDAQYVDASIEIKWQIVGRQHDAGGLAGRLRAVIEINRGPSGPGARKIRR
jgi:hypothetical protein